MVKTYNLILTSTVASLLAKPKQWCWELNPQPFAQQE